MTKYYLLKIFKIALLIVAIIVNSGCDYLSGIDYPYYYKNTVWMSSVPEWVMTVDSDNVMTSVMTIDGKPMEFEINFRGRCIYVDIIYLDMYSSSIFCGSFKLDGDKFVVYNITKDEIFNFKYDRIVFIKSRE